MNIQDLTTDEVIHVYSGKNGYCCCGCAGKHTYNPGHRHLGTVKRGYKVNEDECNLKTVSRILNILKKADLEGNIDDHDEEFISTVVGKRLYIAYLV